MPEKQPRFFRAGCYSNVCSQMAPRGAASLYIEYSSLRRLPRQTPDVSGEYAVRWLKSMGVLGKRAKLLIEVRLGIDCGYVLYDLHRNAAVKTLQQYYRKHAIHSIGRYGSWEYSSMEDAMNQGKVTAELLNDC